MRKSKSVSEKNLHLMIYLEMVRPFDVDNIFRLVFPLVFKVALLFAEVRSGQYKYGIYWSKFFQKCDQLFPIFLCGGLIINTVDGQRGRIMSQK